MRIVGAYGPNGDATAALATWLAPVVAQNGWPTAYTLLPVPSAATAASAPVPVGSVAHDHMVPPFVEMANMPVVGRMPAVLESCQLVCADDLVG